MSLFSEGGFSSPDFPFSLTLILLFIVSSTLNPLIYLYNHRHPITIPRFLFCLLAVFDGLSGVLIPVISVPSIARIG